MRAILNFMFSLKILSRVSFPQEAQIDRKAGKTKKRLRGASDWRLQNMPLAGQKFK